MLKRYVPVAVVGAAMLAVSVAAIAGTDDSNPPGTGIAKIAAVESQAKEAMAILNTGRRTGDALPRDVAERMGAHANFGMNPSLSRLSIANTTNSVYVIPARGHVCASLTVGEGASVICPTTDDVAAGKAGAATVTLETGGIGIYGLVPDGVESVAVQTGASSREQVETQGNAYYIVVPEGTPLRTVSYTGPSGPVEFPIQDPAVVLEE